MNIISWCFVYKLYQSKLRCAFHYCQFNRISNLISGNDHKSMSTCVASLMKLKLVIGNYWTLFVSRFEVVSQKLCPIYVEYSDYFSFTWAHATIHRAVNHLFHTHTWHLSRSSPYLSLPLSLSLQSDKQKSRKLKVPCNWRYSYYREYTTRKCQSINVKPEWSHGANTCLMSGEVTDWANERWRNCETETLLKRNDIKLKMKIENGKWKTTQRYFGSHSSK